MLNAIRKLTEDIEYSIDPKIKEEAVKNISILHDGDDGFIAIANKKDKEYVQYHYKIDDLTYNIGKVKENI